ncbi:MAG: polymer-forming cytoskeletal protein [Candidatus Margulisiibacteriota bacterium]
MFKKVLGFTLLSVLLFSLPVSALTVKTGNDIVIDRETVINDNLFAAGENLTISGWIKGDLIAFGGEVTINGKVDGDIIAGGSNVTIAGKANNIFVGGGDVTIIGSTKNDLLAGCGQIYIDKNARIGKDAWLGCGNAKIAGRVMRDLKVGTGNMKILPNARIFGKLDYSADNFDVSDKAKIIGKTTSFARPDYGEQTSKVFGGIALTHMITSFLAIFVVGILIIVFLPNQVKMITSEMLGKFWKSLGWGIVSLIVIPLASILLCITLIGIPLGVILSLAYVFGIYIAGIFTSVVIGKAIFDRFGKTGINLIWALLAGLIILEMLAFIPLVGWFIKLVLFLWAFGALVSTRFTTYNEAREKGVL